MGIDVGVVVIVLFVFFLTLAVGLPVALSLSFSGLVGVVLMDGFGGATSTVGARLFTSVFSFSLVVIPLFVLMGFFVNHARIGEDLFDSLAKVSKRLPGGMGLASIGACAGFGAVTGASVTGVATIGPIAIREMRKHGYSKEFASGLIAAAGTLGILIPPSIALVLYGFIAEVSISRLLIAGTLPGLFSALVYGVLTVGLAMRRKGRGLEGNPDRAENRRESASHLPAGQNPAAPAGEAPTGNPDHDDQADSGVTVTTGVTRFLIPERIRSNRGLIATLKVVFLFVVVFGSIYAGLATVTESAAVGALFALFMLVSSCWREGVGPVFRRISESVAESVAISSMFFLLLVGGSIFGYYLLISRIPAEFARWIGGLGVTPVLVLALIFLGIIVLGMFLDGISILLITVPLLFPIVVGNFDYNEIWFGVLMVKTIEIGLITPPLGINVYVVAGLFPDIPVDKVFRGVIPFFLADVATVILLFMFPAIVTWLPDQMLGA